MLAVVPVRDGVLPAGGAEAIAEAGGHAVLVGTGAALALDTVQALCPGLARAVGLADSDEPFARLVDALAAIVRADDLDAVVLPASPDGRDLAPLLADTLGRPLLANAVSVRHDGATCARWNGAVYDDLAANGPFVATLLPGVRGLPEPDVAGPAPHVRALALRADATPVATCVAVLPPDLATIDLAEAPRLFGGGAGLDGPERYAQLAAVAAALGAATGATRVVTDRGWAGHERQIGTTGVATHPSVYVAFGVSGAVQHTAGLGDPAHVLSVNVDPYCPMMQRADVAVVADANAVLDELARLLGVETIGLLGTNETVGTEATVGADRTGGRGDR